MVALVLPAPMLVVPFPLPLEPIWVVPLMPLGRPLLPMGLVSLGSITRVPALGSPWLPLFGAPVGAFAGYSGGLGGAIRSLALSRASRLPSFPPNARMALLPIARMPLSIGLTILLAMYMASKAWVRARPTVPLTIPAAVEGTTLVMIRRIDGVRRRALVRDVQIKWGGAMAGYDLRRWRLHKSRTKEESPSLERMQR